MGSRGADDKSGSVSASITPPAPTSWRASSARRSPCPYRRRRTTPDSNRPCISGSRGGPGTARSPTGRASTPISAGTKAGPSSSRGWHIAQCTWRGSGIPSSVCTTIGGGGTPPRRAHGGTTAPGGGLLCLRRGDDPDREPQPGQVGADPGRRGHPGLPSGRVRRGLARPDHGLLDCGVCPRRRRLERHPSPAGAGQPDSGRPAAPPYDPGLPARYPEGAGDDGPVVVPARVRQPPDQANVAPGRQLVERGILAILCKRRFVRVADAPAVVADLVRVRNARPFQKKEGSRSTLLAEPQPALKSRPPHPFEVGTWRRATVPPDDPVEVDRRY